MPYQMGRQERIAHMPRDVHVHGFWCQNASTVLFLFPSTFPVLRITTSQLRIVSSVAAKMVRLNRSVADAVA